MQLFVIRHARAVPRGSHASDVERPLTPEGRERFAKALRGLEAMEVRFDRLLHSPWRRAVETAELASRLARGRLVETDALARRPTRALLSQLEGESIAVVGHQPWLGELVALLVLGDAGAGDRFVLGKGAVAWLEGEPAPGAMTLRALLPSRVLRRIAR